MRNMMRRPKKKRLHHPADESGQNNQWSWIATLLPVKCLEFCSSRGISGLLPSVTITPPGSRICRKVNGEKTYNEQSSCRKAGCDQTTECAETPQSNSHNEIER